ncbi:haloacid dehalogenase type II [Limibaculum sp. FT325]|uniref:haloacid dehalogenase type II n=1 Tax=Thermohalobaculum sediminis TaxID=2939436 RepID=UPI0020BF706D|nr:haloacid dehalogenase type II [Limibaculum sediminis]MCL5776066.1 haloacid dehalogenase type II [Limibaculum sediminis]
MIRAAIFDVFGTVVDWREGVAAAARDAFAAKGLDTDPHAFADAWRAEYQPAMQTVRSGARGYVALDQLHFENLGRVLARLGIADAFTEAEAWALNAAWEKLPPWPDSVAGIAAIRRQMIVAPCSNGSIALMTRLARFGGLPWDCILGADVARAYKPDPLAYRRSVAALRLAPPELLMVAAHNDDLAAARTEGLGTAFVPRPAEHGPGQVRDLAPTADWDFVAPDMIALASMLAE